MNISKTHKNTSSDSNSSKSFFSHKEEEGTFFSKTPKATKPFFSPHPIQAKLTIGRPDDPYEKEADTTADKVVQRLESTEQATVIQEKALNSGQEKNAIKNESSTKQITIMRKSMSEGIEATQDPGSSIESELNTTLGQGEPLPKATRTSMETAFEKDFSAVKIHTDNTSIGLNQKLGARAFTHGSDIYFNQGEYNPNSTEGKHLLAHELTHTVQQNSNSKTIQRFIEPTANNPLTLRTSEVTIENIIGLYISTMPNDYLTADYSYSRPWIDANLSLIRNELIRRLDLKAEQNRGDHLQWFRNYMEAGLEIPISTSRQQEVETMLEERIPNAFLSDEEKELTIDLTVDRLNACARAYLFAAQAVKLDLYRAAQDRAAMINNFVEVLLPFAVPGLGSLLGRSLQTLIIRGEINMSLRGLRERTPHILMAIESLGEFAKRRISGINQQPFQDADGLVDVLANQFNNGIVAMQEKVRRDEFTELQLVGIFTNYDEIKLDGINYYRRELEQLVSQFRAVEALNEESMHFHSERLIRANRLVYIIDGYERRLAVLRRTDPYSRGGGQRIIDSERVYHEFIAFVPNALRDMALSRERNPQEIEAASVIGVPSFSN